MKVEVIKNKQAYFALLSTYTTFTQILQCGF